MADLGGKVTALQRQLEGGRSRERELRTALADLAGAGLFQRGKVLARLKARGLV